MANREKSADGPVIIKKYANRRLYNTARSSYVTLDDLSRMVRAGEDFKVFDAKSGDEITRSVLTQIIFEEEAKGQSMLPTNFLRQIIRLYGDALQNVVPGYLEASMETFTRNQEKMRAAFGTERAMHTFETMARPNMEWFEQAMRMFAPGGPRGGPGPQATGAAGEGGAAEPSRDSGQDLDHLQRQLAEMQAQLERLSQTAPGDPPAPSESEPEPANDPAASPETGKTGSVAPRKKRGTGG